MLIRTGLDAFATAWAGLYKALLLQLRFLAALLAIFCCSPAFAQSGIDVPAAVPRVTPPSSAPPAERAGNWLLPLVNLLGERINQRNDQPGVAPDGVLPAGVSPISSSSGFVFSLPLFRPGPSGAATDADDFEAGQLLILWASEEAAAAGIALLQQNYQLVPSQRHQLENLGLTVILLVLPNDNQARQWRDRLRAEQPEWIVDLNARASPLQSAPPRLYAQKMLDGTAQLQTVSLGSMAAGVRLGVIDTGIDLAMTRAEALNGSAIQLRGLLEAGEQPADPSHGIAVLQLMAGAAQANGFAGAAPPARLFWAAGMRDVGGKAVTNSLLLVRALDWLVGRGVVLVNMSLGGKGDAILQAVVARVLSMNVSIVAAAGNNPASNAPASYPAAYPGVWAATAVDAAGQLYTGATRAPYAMLAAPGAELWVPGSGAGSYVSGTSYASALAAATLAWQAPGFWSLSAAQRIQQVCSQSRKLPDNSFLGCGLVQKAKGEISQSAR